MSWETNNPDINSENIFDEFTDTKEIKAELEKTDKNIEKDIYYYLKKLGTLLLSCNIIVLLLLILCFVYIYIQNGTDKKEYSFLSPVCQYFLWTNEIYSSTCYWVTPILEEYNTKLENISSELSQKVLPLLWEKYSLENYNLSRKVAFILEKWDNRSMPLEMLGEFDALKDIFSATDKSEISCYDINIMWDIMSMTCDSFSSDWNTDIIGVEDTLLTTRSWWGTSISKASSFINFLEHYSWSPFSIVEKPALFTSESTTWPYTRKTSFQFSLRYVKQIELDIN